MYSMEYLFFIPADSIIKKAKEIKSNQYLAKKMKKQGKNSAPYKTALASRHFRKIRK
jgi:hypothetical protein